MKGLILKELYTIKKYCRTYIIIAAVFIAVSFVNSDDLFFAFYPCILVGMLPVTLLGYDERSKWSEYIGTLPYTKSQIVSGKYILGTIVQITVLVLLGAVHAIKMNINGEFNAQDFMLLMAMLVLLSGIAGSICLPFMFKLGVEKGRIAYYVMIGIVCAGSAMGANIFSENLNVKIPFENTWIIMMLAGIVIYALSWRLSIAFYKNKRTS